MLPPEKKIKFSSNWNGKLRCQYFTTIRLENPGYYKPGYYYQIWQKQNNPFTGETKEVYDFNAQLVQVKTFYLHELPEITAILDTGYSLAETVALMKKMYPNTDFTQKKISLLLLKHIEWNNRYG